MFDQDLQFNEFKSQSYSEWLAAAIAQLKGASPEDTLGWSNWDGIQLKPYYDAANAENLTYLGSYTRDANRWTLLEYVQVENESIANKHALDALHMGAEGILFRIKGDEDLPLLTKGIDFEACRVVLISDSLSENVKKFRENENVSALSESVVSSDGVVEDVGQMPIERTASSIRAWYESGASPYFVVTCGPDFFHEMSRLRALRFIVNRLAELNGIEGMAERVRIHVIPSVAKERVENWFCHSSIGLSALLGGADALSFVPLDNEVRISRNVGNLLRDECQLEGTADYALGSHFVDALTDQLIQRIWDRI